MRFHKLLYKEKVNLLVFYFILAIYIIIYIPIIEAEGFNFIGESVGNVIQEVTTHPTTYHHYLNEMKTSNPEMSKFIRDCAQMSEIKFNPDMILHEGLYNLFNLKLYVSQNDHYLNCLDSLNELEMKKNQ